VDDLLEGIVRLMESSCPEPINIGNPDEVTIAELAREVIALTGSSSRIETRPMPKDDPIRRRPDISRARTVLGWEPLVSRREGLTRTFEDFRRRISATG
jgi:dTDP-glucose 4,6-dehydratase